MSEYAELLKDARPRAIAAVSRLSGELAAAEDAVHDAIAEALVRWPVDGEPDVPVAWLITVARRRITDQWRRDTRHPQAPDDVEQLAASELLVPTAIDDDLLRLIFTCCHPALSEDASIALTLRVIVNLSPAEIGRAFLTAERTMEQRLARARKKIREAGIGFELPQEKDLDERLHSVLRVIYLVFNQGYSANAIDTTLDVRMCREAIWLARLLLRLRRSEPEIEGLLALMLLQHARHRARTTPSGDLITLDRQDRSLWDPDLILEGRTLIRRALKRQAPGFYQTQAAIAALHSEASESATTDWAQIEALYAWLEGHGGGAVVSVNRAVAMAMAGANAEGLDHLQSLRLEMKLGQYVPYLAALAELQWRCGDLHAAIAAFQRAADATQSPAEERHFLQRIRDLQAYRSGTTSTAGR